MPHLIIADDNSQFLDLLTTYCQSTGWTVETCLDGDALAQTVMGGTEPALVLIDIKMPNVDGIEVIEHLQKAQRPIRIRFMTGGDSAPLIAAGLIASARDMSVGRSMFKPVGKEEFVRILNEEAGKLAQLSAP
ncbi:response regulator [Tropicibacter oceani]|uniref:Response regulator n=1 Tax=Tropicibacter oceani TaxID=3058420 RepID=A0ABY8QCC1_9RHOB|nr:response regulator [Tropicibacter oceani]WGW02264.1 response regulator [Tropicibacter oceani]